MKQLALVSLMVLSALIFLLAGCGGGGSQPEQQQEEEGHAHQSHSAASLAMHPVGDSGVSGTATFKDLEEKDGVIVMLELRGLPKANTLYLAHIHPGSCTQEEEQEVGGPTSTRRKVPPTSTGSTKRRRKGKPTSSTARRSSTRSRR